MKVFGRKSILFLLPFLIPISFFLIIDPYMLFGENKGHMNMTGDYYVTGNRDFQSTELLKKNRNKFDYDSFIFGNSRSFFFRCNSWNQYIDGQSFHFNVPSESSFGILGKLNFLQKYNIQLRNVLLVIDPQVIFVTENSKGHVLIKHPEVSGGTYSTFYTEMFKGFFPKAMIPFLDLFITGKRKVYMSNVGIRKSIWSLDEKHNELTYTGLDHQIQEDSIEFYASRRGMFRVKQYADSVAEPFIDERQKLMLRSIADILISQETTYKVVLNPMYNQVYLNPVDVNIIDEIFGKEHVFDFTGENTFTKDIGNWYETSHYRPHVADSILKVIYDDREVDNLAGIESVIK